MARTLRPWTVLSRDLLFDGSPWLRVWRERVRAEGPGAHDFYTLEKPDFALACALTPDGHVVMERQYRHGLRGVTLGVPGGIVDEGEAPLDAARRELLEETGYAADEWEHLGSFVVDGLRGAGRAHCYLARGARPAPEAAPVRDDLEDIEPVVLPWADALAALSRGEVGTLGAAACLALAAARLRGSQ